MAVRLCPRMSGAIDAQFDAQAGPNTVPRVLARLATFGANGLDGDLAWVADH